MGSAGWHLAFGLSQDAICVKDTLGHGAGFNKPNSVQATEGGAAAGETFGSAPPVSQRLTAQRTAEPQGAPIPIISNLLIVTMRVATKRLRRRRRGHPAQMGDCQVAGVADSPVAVDNLQAVAGNLAGNIPEGDRLYASQRRLLRSTRRAPRIPS